MATYTDNYNLTKPTFAESADIRTINGNMDTIDAVMHASQVSLADAYDETRTASNPYNTGDIVMYELLMYKCLEDGVYGTWDGTKWERTTAGANGGGSDVEVTPSYNSGTKIAEIDVDGNTEEIYVPEMTGASSSSDGTAGLPPAPEAGDEDKFFRGDGTWAEVGQVYGKSSGNIATFDDGGDNKPLKSLKVAINPVQDLHGYDSPWVGGAGKNKLPIDEVIHSNSTGDINIFSGSISGTYTISIDTTEITSVVSPNASVLKYIVDGTERYMGYSVGHVTFTGELTKITVFSATTYCKYIGKAKFQLEEGSTVTAWQPYSNICPISGWTGADVYDDSAYGGFINWNQYLKPNSGIWEGLTATLDSEGTISLGGTSTTSYARIFANYLPIVGHKYFIGSKIISNPNNINFNIGLFNAQLSPNTTIPINTYTVRNVSISSGNSFGIAGFSANTDFTGVKFNAMLIDLTQCFGETKANEIYTMEQSQTGSGVEYVKSLFPKDYYSFNTGTITCVSAVNDNSYEKVSVSWQSSEGEIFGGNADIVTGDGKKTWAKVDLSSLSYTTTSWGAYRASLGNNRGFASGDVTTALATKYSPTSYTDLNGNKPNNYFAMDGGSTPYLYIMTDGGRPTGNLVYELATASYEDFTFAPTQIFTLLGTNDIWSDTGDILECVYQRDLNLVINQFDARITALEQALNSSGTRSLSLSKSAVNEEETKEEITEEPKEEEQNEDKR